jgi:hypothetical protein
MSEYNTELWDELTAMRRDIRVLKAAVRRLEASDLERYLFQQRLHDVTRCGECGETHECAVISGSMKSTNGELVALCESCWTRNRQQVAA